MATGGSTLIGTNFLSHFSMAAKALPSAQAGNFRSQTEVVNIHLEYWGERRTSPGMFLG